MKHKLNKIKNLSTSCRICGKFFYRDDLMKMFPDPKDIDLHPEGCKIVSEDLYDGEDDDYVKRLN